MSLQSSQNLAPEGAGSRATMQRLAKVFRPDESYPFDRLSDLVEPPSDAHLARLLGELIEKQILTVIFRVESPEWNSGIKDFSSPDEVPETIYDVYAGKEIPVTTDNVRVLYALSGI